MASFFGFPEKMFAESTSFPLFIVTLLTLLVSVYSAWHGRKSAIALHRLEEIFSPLFEQIEPFMFRNAPDPDSKSLERLLKTLKDHPLLIGGKLRRFLGYAPDLLLESNAWKPLFRAIANSYDKLCFEAGIPLRTAVYRVFRYKPSFIRISIPLAIIRILINTAMCFFSLFCAFGFFYSIYVQQLTAIIFYLVLLLISLLVFFYSDPRH